MTRPGGLPNPFAETQQDLEAEKIKMLQRRIARLRRRRPVAPQRVVARAAAEVTVPHNTGLVLATLPAVSVTAGSFVYIAAQVEWRLASGPAPQARFYIDSNTSGHISGAVEFNLLTPPGAYTRVALPSGRFAGDGGASSAFVATPTGTQPAAVYTLRVGTLLIGTPGSITIKNVDMRAFVLS